MNTALGRPGSRQLGSGLLMGGVRPTRLKDTMIHNKRSFQLRNVETLDELARLLTEHTWTACTGFKHAGWLFLNDAFSGDGAQEYAVVRDERQYESVTFSWMSTAAALDWLQRWLVRELPEPIATVRLIEHPAGCCPRCA